MLTIVRGPDLTYFTCAVLEREQREVTSHADVAARVDDRADLADQDVAGEHRLARRGA